VSPNKPVMILKSFRVPKRLWEDAMRVAAANEENLADVLRDALELYVKAGPKKH
jgi:hypothetical protein